MEQGEAAVPKQRQNKHTASDIKQWIIIGLSMCNTQYFVLCHDTEQKEVGSHYIFKH